MKTTIRSEIRLKTLCLFVPIITIFLMLCTNVNAANTFKDPDNRFVIDLPSGWKLQPQTDNTVYVFQGKDSNIIIEFSGENKTREQLFASGMSTMKASGLINAKPEKSVRNLKMNGNPARLGLYKDTVLYGSTKVVLYGLLGSVSLEKGGLYFLSILNNKTIKSDRKKIEKSFNSIRDSGAKVTKAVDEGEAAADAPTETAGKVTEYSNQYISLQLPPGWKEKEIPAGSEKEFMAFFGSNTVSGASITIHSYKGIFSGATNVRIRGLKTIASAYPKGQEELKKSKKIVTDTGYKPKIELWRGYLDSGGITVTLQSPMAIMKTKNGGWIMMIGYVADAHGEWMEEEFLKILNTIK